MERTQLLLARVLRAVLYWHSPACCAAEQGCSSTACAMLHKLACCELQLRWWLPALAPLTIVVPSLLTSEVVTGTTSSVLLRKCGS